MNMIKTWFFILIKCRMKNIKYILVFLMIPIITCLLARISETGRTKVYKVYIYFCGDSEMENAIIKELSDDYSEYQFLTAESEEQILREVKSGKALAGYIFRENLEERIMAGIFKNNIKLVERIGEVHTDIVNEIVYKAYYKQLAKCYTYSELSGNVSYIEKYDSIINKTGDVISVEEKLPDKDDYELSGINIKGCIAVFLCIFVLVVAGHYAQDIQRGILFPVPYQYRFMFRIIYFTSEFIVITPFVILGLLPGIKYENIIMELIRIIIYEMALVIIGVILSCFLHNSKVIIGIIPFVSLIMLCISPVFIDASYYIPIVKIIRYICPPCYYLGVV